MRGTAPQSTCVQRDIEKAYRRGYAQGAYIAIEAYKEGIAQSRIDKWFNAVVRWRYAMSKATTLSKSGTRRSWRCPPEPFDVKPKKQVAVMREGGDHE